MRWTPQLARDLLSNGQEHFDRGALARGRRYFEQGRVREIQLDQHVIEATVEGANPYRVEVELFHLELPKRRTRGGPALHDLLDVDGQCSCPVALNCKHVVAVLHAFAEAPAHAKGGAVLPPPELIEWAQRYRRRLGAGGAEAPAEPETSPQRDLVVYLLSPRRPYHDPISRARYRRISPSERAAGEAPDADGPTNVLLDGVRRAVARPKKAGGFGRPRHHHTVDRWHDVGGLRSLGSDADFAVAVEVCRRGKHEDAGGVVVDAVLLQRLLATGRLLVEEDYAAGPIGEGPAREGAVSFESSDGVVAPRVLVEGEALPLVPCVPLHYVDTGRGQAGRVALDGIAHEAIAQLLRCPPFSKEHAMLVEGVLEEALGDARRVLPPIPKPRRKPAAPLRLGKPRALIELSADKGGDVTSSPSRRWRGQGRGAESSKDQVLVLALRFAYGDHLVHADFRTEFGGIRGSTTAGPFVRDADEEAGTVERLKEWGFDWTYEEQARGRMVMEEPVGTERARRFVLRGIPELERDGCRIHVSGELPVRVLESDAWVLDLEHEAGSDWFEATLGIEVDGRRINVLPALLEWIDTAEGQRAIRGLSSPAAGERSSPGAPSSSPVHLQVEDGTYVAVDSERMARLVATLVQLLRDRRAAGERLTLHRLDAPELMDAERSDLVEVRGGKSLRDWARQLQRFDALGAPHAPEHLQATLRPYQEKGLAWLQFLSDFGVSGILADDMGLGKTLQVLAFFAAEAERGKNAGEGRRPNLAVAPTSVLSVWEEQARQFVPGLRVFLHHGESRLSSPESARPWDLIVTSYDLLRRDAELFRAIPFHAAVFDEAQALKNPSTRVHRVARSIDARVRMSLTGTPMENHLGELFAQFAVLMPGLLGSSESFGRCFRRPIEREGDTQAMDALRARVRPFILRRLKSEVAKELPPKTEIPRYVELQAAQRDLYEAVRLSMDARIRQALKQRGLAQSSVTILDALLKLRQVCCHPGLLDDERARSVAESAKLDALLEMLGALVEEGRRTLVFSQFTSMLAVIEAKLVERGVRHLKLTGQTRGRKALVEKFQEGDVPVFLISLKAGGTGLTLTAADTVIHYDPWWNPAVETQATDRTHRIGQTLPITVYRLICQGTVEQKILGLQEKKGRLASDLLEGRGGMAGLTADDVRALFA